MTSRLTEEDRSLITRARTLVDITDEAALREHTGQPDSILFAYVRAFGQARHVLGELVERFVAIAEDGKDSSDDAR